MGETEAKGPPSLVRGLGAWDGTLITIGSILGSAIFIAAADVPRAVPHAGLVLVLWTLGGLLTMAGALTYAELAAMFPRAGGQYHFLKEAYGRFWGFLFGWASFLVIMCGGLAALAAGFGAYLGSFVPFFSVENVLLVVPAGSARWAMNGSQVAGALALVFLTAVNYLGLKEGAFFQNALTVLKVGSIVVLALIGLVVPARATADLFAPLPAGDLAAALGVGMIAVFWSYDGWYGLTNVAGEMREPGRDLPRSVLAGTLAVVVLYLAVNAVYLRALPVEGMARSARIGEGAAAVLFGPTGARVVSAAVLVSIFGCLSSTILWAARIYLPMAEDRVFFRSLARIHPRYRTPSLSILAQGVWSIALTFSGTYEQLFTYVIFAVFLFHAATGAAVFVLRRTRPDAPRPFRVWGYPVLPLVFVLTSLAFVANTLVEKPKESGVGLALLALGLPAYLWWRRTEAA
jgi:basic amino acid/polyamine antiporter, APA family